MKKFWYTYGSLASVVAFQLLLLPLCFGACGVIGQQINADSGFSEGMGAGILVWFVVAIFAARITLDRVEAKGGSYIRHAGDLSCYILPAQAGWVLQQAFKKRGFSNHDKSYNRFAAAFLADEKTGVSEIVVGKWEIGHSLPRIIHREAIKVGHDPDLKMIEWIGSRLSLLEAQATAWEEQDFLQGSEDRRIIQGQDLLQKEESEACQKQAARHQRMLAQVLS